MSGASGDRPARAKRQNAAEHQQVQGEPVDGPALPRNVRAVRLVHHGEADRDVTW